MLLLVVAATVLVAALTVHLVAPALRRRRMASELHANWWPHFEREFRAYASQAWRSAREAERRA